MVHKLALFETAPYASGRFLCNLCWEKGCGPVYHCSECDFDIHITCAAIAKQQTHFSHYHHLLHLCHCSTHHTCDGCGEGIHTWAFRCETCDFDMHSLCVRAPRFIMHPTHSHPLTLIKSKENRDVCNACEMPTTDFFYQCPSCNYRLHQFCATLPSRIQHSRHPQHMLKLVSKPQADFTCGQCGEHGKSWRFHCASCNFYTHPRCTNISHELPHPDLEVSSLQSKSNATTSSSSSVLHNVSCVPALSNQDLEAIERVLRFARDIVNSPSTHATDEVSESCPNDERDTCPTCLEGYTVENPKRSTSCGHHFHLACILTWMERCTRCPICRKNVNILM